jgi:hypothetical protein
MKTLIINENNKSYFTKRYVDHILSRMDQTDIWGSLKNYLFKEKIKYPTDTLQAEIKRYCPSILEEHLSESVVGKGEEYDENF